MKKILITGITGFAGYHLAKYLTDTTEHTIIGTYHSDSSLSQVADLREKVHFYSLDLTDKFSVFDLIEKIRPDEIYHLAAQTSTPDSFVDPEKTLLTNIFPEVYIFEAVKKVGLFDTRILIVSTSEVYGLILPNDLPIDEETPLRPLNPYAVSKVAQDLLGLQYFYVDQLQIIRARPFNHIGPRQKPKFVLPMFAKQIVEIEKGQKEPVLMVGNLKVKRDFTDVRDIVRAYVLLMEKGVAGDVYNIGSGKSVEIQELLNILLSLTDRVIEVKEDPQLFRKIEVRDVVCNNSKLIQITGWKPQISLERTLSDTLDYFRNVV